MWHSCILIFKIIEYYLSLPINSKIKNAVGNLEIKLLLRLDFVAQELVEACSKPFVRSLHMLLPAWSSSHSSNIPSSNFTLNKNFEL